jgi:hypothetical protein
LKLAQRYVVIGKQQTVGADEGTRAAIIQSHARQAYVIQPLLRRREVVFLLELLDGRIVESPHALVGARNTGHQSAAKGNNVKPTERMSHLQLNLLISIVPAGA